MFADVDARTAFALAMSFLTFISVFAFIFSLARRRWWTY